MEDGIDEQNDVWLEWVLRWPWRVSLGICRKVHQARIAFEPTRHPRNALRVCPSPLHISDIPWAVLSVHPCPRGRKRPYRGALLSRPRQFGIACHKLVHTCMYAHAMKCHEMHACTHMCSYMHVCMYVRMYVCMYVCTTFVRTYVCIYACMHTCMHVCMYAYMHACMYVCM